MTLNTKYVFTRFTLEMPHQNTKQTEEVCNCTRRWPTKKTARRAGFSLVECNNEDTYIYTIVVMIGQQLIAHRYSITRFGNSNNKTHYRVTSQSVHICGTALK